nr:hypothetical protein [uncultured Anaerostipes sp.]
MKKVLGALLMLSMAIGGTVVAPNTTKDVHAATTIQSNRWYEGMTDGESDQVYTYKMQGSGYFYYQVVPDQGGYYYDGEYESSTSYRVSTSMIKNYKFYEKNEDCYYSEGGFKSGIYGFKPGDNINIKVNDAPKDKTHYKIKVTFVKVKNFERENNNSRSKANKIKKGITYTGLAMSDNDDWFVFKAPKTKKYKIKVVNTTKATWWAEAESYLGYTKKDRETLWGDDGWKTVYSGKIKKGKKVYIKISNWGSTNIYKLRVK